MTDNERKVLEGFAQKTLNLSAEETATLYNAEGELSDVTVLVNKDAEKVLKYKNESKSQHDRGFKEGAVKLEKELKEKYELESDLIGVELVDHLIEAKTTELNEKFENLKKSKLKDDDFEKHPKFAALKLEHEKQLKAKDTEWIEKFKAKEAEQLRKETFDRVSKLAMVDVETGFVLPEKPERAAALKDVLLKELESENYSFQDDTVVILDKDGKPREDAHGKLINFKEHVHNIASKYFDVKVAEKRANAGNETKKTEAGGNGQMKFKNRDEQNAAFKALDESKITEDEKRVKRIEIKNSLIEN